jgi:predicted nucleotidyltransferase
MTHGQGIQLPSGRHQIILERFFAACQADARVAAAFLGGSYARGAADAHSDLDLVVILADDAYDEFVAGRATFIRQLGVPVFLEDSPGHGAEFVFFILADGSEGELGIGRVSHYTHLHAGPYRTLLDRDGVLVGARFPWPEVPPADQTKVLHDLIHWFWHDLSHHFITPLARGQLWSAYGALEDLRRACVNLARLRERFSAEIEGYEKVEQAVPRARLAPLEKTCCPLTRERMLRAARALVRYYEDVAPPLASAHGVSYPTDLARIITARLERLGRG